MTGIQLPSGSRVQATGFNVGTVIQVPSAAAGGTKGAWTAIITSLDFDCDYLMVSMGWGSGTRTYLADIGVGGAGSEVAIVTDIPCESSNSVCPQGISQVIVPAKIKAGSRISARVNISGATTKQISMWIVPIAGGYIGQYNYQQCTTYGTTSTPALTNIDPGGTINTKSAWVQLVAATTADIKGLIMFFMKTGTPPATSPDWKVDFGIGAAASEQILIPDYYVSCSTQASQVPHPSNTPIIPMEIPEGTRLAMRAACSMNTSGTRTLDVAVMGLS